MDIKTHMHHDHQDHRALAADIMKSADGNDVGGRDNQFDLYDMQIRRHLAVVEDVLLSPLKKDEHVASLVSDIKGKHKEVRKSLKQLDRGNKGSNEWTAEFRNLVDQVETVHTLHERVLEHGQAVHAAQFRSIDDDYERAKIKRLEGHFSWNRFPGMSSMPSMNGRTGTAAAVAAGAAALAGAAYAANRYFSSGRRASGRKDDDFELRLETDENLRLISSTKVEGTPVVDRDGSKIGTIDNVMIDKYSGRVAYAVMSFKGTMFGGSLGSSLFPLPWPLLDYDEEKDGYALDITKEEMQNAPRFEPNEEPEFSPEYRRRILVFYRPAGTSSATGSPDSWSASANTGNRSEGSSVVGAGAKVSDSQSANGSNNRSTNASDTNPSNKPVPTSVG